MRIKFESEETKKTISEKLKGKNSVNIELKDIMSCEYKEEIIKEPKRIGLIDKVQIIEVEHKAGRILKAINTGAKLTNVEVNPSIVGFYFVDQEVNAEATADPGTEKEVNAEATADPGTEKEVNTEVTADPGTEKEVNTEVTADPGTEKEDASIKMATIKKAVRIETDVEAKNFYKPISWKLEDHVGTFEVSNSLLDNNEFIEKDLFSTAHNMATNTENDIIYNYLTKKSMQDIQVTPETTGEKLRTELKAFIKSISTNKKRVYISFNLLDELEAISKKLNVILITDNPNIVGGKMLCGVPIEAFDNDILKPYNQKELIICGDLYGAVALFRYREYKFDTTRALSFGYTSCRLTQGYDCKKSYSDVVIAQINL